MSRYRYIKRVCILVAILAFAITLFAVNREYRLYDRLLFGLREWRHSHEWKDRSLWLPDYIVALEAVPIEEVEDNLSGLTWNNDTKSLFAVINWPPGVVELSTMDDMNNLYLVSEPNLLYVFTRKQ